jgi:transcriptional regulator with XRE-family HTH domain
MEEKINKIGAAIKSSKLQVAALALYLDIDDTSISKWNSNKAQPSLKRLNEVGEILEINNIDLLYSIPRVSTGLAEALQIEYKRLLKSGMPQKIKAADKDGNLKEVNNQAFVKALQDFVIAYKNVYHNEKL